MGKASKKNQQQQTYYQKKMSKPNETRAKRIAKHLFRSLKLLSGELRKFLKSRGLLGGNVGRRDSQKCLKIMLKRCNSPQFLLRNGKSNQAVKKIIKNAITGRNKVSHNELPRISLEWKNYLKSWIDTAHLIGASKTATKIRRTLRFLTKTKRIPKGPASEMSKLAMFHKLEAQKSAKWTHTKEEVAVFIGDVLYDIIIDEFSPALEDFLTSKNLQNATSVIDCYAQINLIFDKCTSNDFESPHDGSIFNMNQLHNAMSGRHASRGEGG